MPNDRPKPKTDPAKDAPAPDGPAQAGPERCRRSLARLQRIFEGISATVNEVLAWRCPDINAAGCGAAHFASRNQERRAGAGPLYRCPGSDGLDYRAGRETPGGMPGN